MAALEIPLTRGLVTIVDEEDHWHLSWFKWSARGNDQKGFDAVHRHPNGKLLSMHRWIMGAPAGMVVDHINGDPLDNRRSNLRVCTQAENLRNQRKHRDSTQPYKGINQRGASRWYAHISVKGRLRHLGTFPTAEEAARAYDDAARLHFGEFARPNFDERA